MDNYDIVAFIGEGAFGKVYLVKDNNGKELALKTLSFGKMDEYEKGKCKQEVKLLSELNHPNILSYVASCFDGDTLCILTEYCPNGDLDQYVEMKCGARLEEERLIEWFRQITSAIEYLHERHIIHRDLKGQNIFLDVNMDCRLGDFGIARVLETAQDMACTQIGTLPFMSPEVFLGIPYNEKTDIWSLAVVVYELATLEKPFKADYLNGLIYKITRGEKPPMPSGYGPEFREVLSSMMEKQPEDRPSATEILSHYVFLNAKKPPPLPNLKTKPEKSKLPQPVQNDLDRYMKALEKTMSTIKPSAAKQETIDVQQEEEDVVGRTLRFMGIDTGDQDFGTGPEAIIKKRMHALKLYIMRSLDNDEDLFAAADKELEKENTDIDDLEENLIRVLGDDKFAVCGMQFIMYKNFSFNLRS